jgi:serine/threonine protein kinase/tetratricopeptide (TPR) repeat protein
MPRIDADRNLLFGITALQMDLIARDDLIAAMNAWVLAKHRAIGEILVEQKALGPNERDALEAMLACRLAKHGDNPARSLAALSSAEGIAADIQQAITDPDVQASIGHIPADPHATRAPETVDYIPPHIRYRKVRDHAKGGLGIVYVALDGELKREVALKEIKPEFADDPGSQARFLFEAEVTGGLEHPGIVPVYGLGHHDDGRPYYTMRFIRGNSLKDAIKAFHADAAFQSDPGARTLALQKMLRRFLDVCNAVAYAHSRGVLHRDLKPDNVMVGRYGETLVVDWGLAKAVGRSGDDGYGPLPESTIRYKSSSGSAETLPGSVVGTPGYMSPEQASSRLDLLGPASDVYGLGATLYTLLTGHAPIAGHDIPEVLRKVERGEFPRPRERSPWLDPALEAICLKSMALKPEARYSSPRALADDLERWLADEPIAAYREPWTRKMGRWSRKHRTAVTTVAATVLVSTLLIVAYAWTIRERTRRADAAGLETLAKVEFLAAEARKTEGPVRWSEALAEARRAEAQLEAGGGSEATKSRARAKLAGLGAVLRVVEGDRKMVDALDEARLLGANVKHGYFDNDAKVEAILAAFRSHGIDLENLASEDAAARVRSSRIAAELVAALDEAIPFVTPALRERMTAVARLADAGGAEIRDRIARNDFEGLRRLVADEAGRLKWKARSRTIFDALATLDPTASLPLLEAIHGRHRTDFWLTHDLARACAKAKPPRLELAIRYYYAAAALKPTSPGVFTNLGLALSDKGELDAAIAAYREAIRLKPDYAEAHSNLGGALSEKGEWDAAIATYREAIRLKPDYAEAHSNLGGALSEKGELDAAIAAYREAIRLKPDLAVAHNNLGNALNSKGEWDAAIAACRESIRLEPDLAVAHNTLGNALNSKGEWDAAIAAYREAIRLEPDDAVAHYNLGNALKSKGELDAAIAAYRESIRLKPDYAEAHCNLGGILEAQGRFAEALSFLERGHELGSRTKGWRYPSAQWVQRCRRWVELDAKLPAVLKGEGPTIGPGDRLELGVLCYNKALHAASTRFYDQAFADQPQLAEDLDAGNRYNAACAAALAGSGAGKDDPPPDDSTRARLREQARAWLRADLVAWGKVLDGGDAKAQPVIVQTLAHWKEDTDLAGIRDEAALAKLPEGEREAFRALWADVEALRVKAGEGK